MAYWEFLLQKEGDRDWLPLETAHVEISEGRYRIIAHTSYCETSVEIYLIQLLANQLPPKRKTRKRIGQTTANGLMVVIPFTHLTAGSWTVKCLAASSATATPDNRWEYGVQLQVLAVESGLEYWDSDLEESPPSDATAPNATTTDSTAAGTPPAIPSTSRSQPQLPQLPSPGPASDDEPVTSRAVAQPPTRDAVPASSAAVDDPQEVLQTASASAVAPALDAAPIEDLPLRLQLQHQAIVAQPRAALSLQGQVTTFSQVEGLPAGGTLWIQLRDPETGVVVHRESRSLSLDSIPSRFECPISLPENSTSRLLVGEMSLWSVLTPPQILAIQGFTVTLNLDALLESVANQGEHSTEITFEDLTSEAATPANSEKEEAATNKASAAAQLASPLAHRDIPFRRIYLPSAGLTLPPVIYRPVDSKGMGEPSLPLLSNQASRRRHTDDSVTSRLAKPLSLPPIGNPSKSSRRRQTTNPQLDAPAPQQERLSAEPSQRPSPNLDETGSDSDIATFFAAEETVQGTHESTFQPDFHGRFWSRLSALAHEAQRAAADLKAQMEAAGVETSSHAPTIESLDEPSASTSDMATPLNHEVVIYDLSAEGIIPPDSAEADFLGGPYAADPLPTNAASMEALGEIPVPQLSLPEGDLISGTSLPITVRLPSYPKRLAVKVWVTDIQSRSLADRPRWLMNWTPAGNGEQTALLNLQVPHGSLEAQFEAIAIDLTTQRESYKTTLVRTIIPPNLPEADLTEPI